MQDSVSQIIYVLTFRMHYFNRNTNWKVNFHQHTVCDMQLVIFVLHRLLVERVFNTCLVQYNAPVEERMRRLYLLYATLDDHAVKYVLYSYIVL